MVDQTNKAAEATTVTANVEQPAAGKDAAEKTAPVNTKGALATEQAASKQKAPKHVVPEQALAGTLATKSGASPRAWPERARAGRSYPEHSTKWSA